MTNWDPGRTDARLNHLSRIERLLDDYRVTKDRRLLHRAIELWDEAEAASKVRAESTRMRSH
jgi:hypothetical protein